MKTLLRKISRPVAITLLLAFTVVACIPQNAAAYVPGSGEMSKAGSHDIETLKRSIESKVVSGMLKSMGFTPLEINERLSNLSDAELHSFAMKADTLSHGSGIVSLIIIIALLALVGLTVLASTGKRIVIE